MKMIYREFKKEFKEKMDEKLIKLANLNKRRFIADRRMIGEH